MDNYFTLQNILDSIMNNHVLSSWNIFPEKSGSVMVKIRLMPVMGDNEEHSGAVNTAAIESSCKLRVVSAKQVARNNERARKHQQTLNSKPSRDRKKPDFYSDPSNSIETPRSDNSVPVQQSPISMQSPETVQPSHIASPDPLINCLSSPTLPHSMATAPCNVAGLCAELESELELSHESEGLTQSSSEPIYRPTPFVELKESPAVTDEIFELEHYEHEDFWENFDNFQECNFKHCFHRKKNGVTDEDYNNSTEFIYFCIACTQGRRPVRETSKFCLKCINAGVHELHRPWLKKYKLL